MMLLTVLLAPKTYWIDQTPAGRAATAWSVDARRSSEVLKDDLKDELGVELLRVDASRKNIPDVHEEARGGRRSEQSGSLGGLHEKG